MSKRSWILLATGGGLLVVITACYAVTGGQVPALGNRAQIKEPAKPPEFAGGDTPPPVVVSSAAPAVPFKGWVMGLDTTPPPKGVPTPALNVPFIDPVYNTRITRVTDPSQIKDEPPLYVRHEYSRRPAFNADSSKVLMLSSNGWIRLYAVDKPGNRLSYLKTLKAGGSIEPNWDPTDPNVFYHFGPNGAGFQIYKYDITNDSDTVARDLGARVKALYPAAAVMWTKEEGRPSKDGRLWCMMIEAYNETTKQVSHFGYIAYDFKADKILGHHATTDRPDHISATPLGNYCVPSSDHKEGTRAYRPDFAKFVQLHTRSEHSDFGLTKDGKEVFLHSDYSPGPHGGYLVQVDVDTGKETDLLRIYGPKHSATALHVSGTAMDRPGFFVVDFDNCTEDHGSSPCDPKKQWFYNKTVIIELGETPKLYNLAHTHFGDAGYWGETQSVANRDLTKVLFASSWGKTDENAVSSYMVDVPPLK